MRVPLAKTDAVTLCGVAEVAFVVLAEAFVEPFGYSGRVAAGAEDAVLDIAGHVA